MYSNGFYIDFGIFPFQYKSTGVDIPPVSTFIFDEITDELWKNDFKVGLDKFGNILYIG